MGRFGCSGHGDLNSSKFSKPMPWIGIYIAAASLACSFAMAADAFHGFRHRNLWFPCRYFSLNAASLALLAIAVKLPMDLNTSMPHRQEQLSKLGSTILMCIAMGNFMPSLGTMGAKEISMNMMALGILVITLVVNICIQMGTGVIYVFQLEHAIIMLFMLVLLAILSSSALTVPTTKKFLEKKYRKKYQLAASEGLQDDTGRFVVKKLNEDVQKYWMMAHTCNPQYVMGRSVTCTAAGAFSLLSTLILVETMLRSYMMEGSFRFCSGESDYKWSIPLVLVTQTIAVVVGTIAPASRWFNAINVRCKEGSSFKNEFKVERFWVQSVVEWKENPLAVHIRGRQCRKLVHCTKNLLLDISIQMQTVVVLMSKFVRFISILFMSQVNKFLYCCCCCCKRLLRKLKANRNFPNDDPESELQSSMKLDLIRFVLHLEGEEKMVEFIRKNGCKDTNHWIGRGRKKQPKHLIQLLDKSTMSQGFRGVREFDSDQVPSLASEKTPNCWALPVVTLTSIAVALPNIDHNLIEQLLCGVSEGLKYVRLIENNLDANGSLINIRRAADMVWLKVDLYRRWLDEDLHKMALEGKHPKEIIETLADIGEDCVMEFKKNSLNECGMRENPLEWPTKVLAANAMYRLSRTIIEEYNNNSSSYQMADVLFYKLSVVISDILGACLTNLPRVIFMQCFCSAIEERERRVRKAANLLGETENILKTLDQQKVPALKPDQMAYIDEWRFHSKQMNPSSPLSTSSNNNMSGLVPGELYLSID